MQMMIMLLPTIAERIDCSDSLLDFGAGPTIYVSVVFRNKVNNVSILNFPDKLFVRFLIIPVAIDF